MVKVNEVKSKRLSMPILQKELDSVFSVYIRLRDANENGYCKCITCGIMIDWRIIHNGHYIPRKHIATRYDIRNCHSQCAFCNIYLDGDLQKYKLAIIQKYGIKVLEELEAGKRSLEKWTIADYREKIAFYKAEVKRLKKEKGL